MLSNNLAKLLEYMIVRPRGPKLRAHDLNKEGRLFPDLTSILAYDKVEYSRKYMV